MQLSGQIYIALAVLLMPSVAAAADGPELSLACGSGHVGVSEPEEVTDWDSLSSAEVEALSVQWRAEQLARGDWTTLVGPYYSTQDGDRATLYLMNQFAVQRDVEVVAVNSGGEEYPLGVVRVLPRSHVELDLEEALVDADTSFATGSVRTRFFGNPTMIVGGVVQRRGGAVAELPLRAPAAERGNDDHVTYAFWDAELLPPDSGRPRFVVVNAGDSPAEVATRFGARGKLLSSTAKVVAPSFQESIVPPDGLSSRSGYVEIRTAAGAERPMVIGWLEGSETLIGIPTFQIEEGAGEREYVSMEARLRTPSAEGPLSSKLTLTMFNPFQEAQMLRVDVLDHMSGTILVERRIAIGAMEVESVDVTGDVVARGAVSIPDSIRIRVSSDSVIAPPFATVAAANGGITALAFFPASSAHPGGKFPVPRLDENEVWTTIVNLGEEPTIVLGQLFWDGGTSALDPIEIAPGSAATFDFRKIASDAKPDLLGRAPSGILPAGYFHWIFRSGSPNLISLTYVQPDDALAPYEVRCRECCHQLPVGEIIPIGLGGTVDFLPGQTPNAIAAYKYQTCDGVLGPWSSMPDTFNVPSPFTWNATKVGASGAASGSLVGDGPSLEAIGFSCNIFQKLVKRFFKGITCRELLRKPHAPNHFWQPPGATCASQVGDRPTNQQKCVSCHNCCDQIFAYRLCGFLPSLPAAQQELQICKVTCATDIPGCS